MRRRFDTRLFLSIASLVAWAGLVHLAHRAAQGSQPPETETLLFIPDGKALRHFALGQHTTLADLYWLKLIQYLGGTEGQQPKILALGHLITDLDPEYGYAYMATGLALSAKGRIHESNSILEKGVPNAPSRWEIPFYLSYNHWYELGDWEKGAFWLQRAVDVPNSPSYLPALLTRLLATAGDVDSAIAFVEAMAAEVPDERSKAEFRHRIGQLVLERDLQALERGIEAFRRAQGRLPWGLEELGSPVLDRLSRPVASYSYDPVRGTVACPLLERRLKVNVSKNVKVEVFASGGEK